MSDTLITPGAGTLTLTGAVSYTGPYGVDRMRTYQGTGTAHAGAVATATMRKYRASGQSQQAAAVGQAAMRKFAATGYAGYPSTPALRKYKGTGQASGAVVGAGTLRSYKASQIIGTPRLRRYTVVANASAVLAEVYRTHVMNTSTNAVTEYTNFRFNSFARIGNDYYGCGPDGFIKLDGVTDAGANIDWKVRTGQIDDGKVGLKRLPEVVLGLRASGPIRVRVYPDDNRFYDYMLPNVKTDTLRQHRVKPGKGMTGRYFAVELQGVANAGIEVDSLQLNMVPTTRRIG